MRAPDETLFRVAARWLTYPSAWGLLALFWWLATTGRLPLDAAAGVFALTLVISLVVLERLAPYQRRWSMTWPTFRADLKYILVNAPMIALVSYGLAAVSISAMAGRTGPASDWPVWAQFLSALLIFEFLNYHLHRAMHEAPGPLGRFLWLVHAAHHLPQRLYVVMHAVFHPINQLLLQPFVIIIPLWAMGYDPLVVISFLMVNNLHGIISHFNVDIRMGWLNYIFVGPELHRYHHAADPRLAKNYGAVTPLYDLLFGTFVYRPGIAPDELGVAEQALYPNYRAYLQVLMLPFRGLGRRVGSAAEVR